MPPETTVGDWLVLVGVVVDEEEELDEPEVDEPDEVEDPEVPDEVPEDGLVVAVVPSVVWPEDVAVALAPGSCSATRTPMAIVAPPARPATHRDKSRTRLIARSRSVDSVRLTRGFTSGPPWSCVAFSAARGIAHRLHPSQPSQAQAARSVR